MLLRPSTRVQIQAEKRLFNLLFIKMPALVVAFGKMTTRNAKITFLGRNNNLKLLLSLKCLPWLLHLALKFKNSFKIIISQDETKNEKFKC
jgi:hypothetical protein